MRFVLRLIRRIVALLFKRILLPAILVGLLYLAFWPIPIEPEPWTPSADPGFAGPYAANERLASTEIIDLGGLVGPEDLARAPDGRVWAATESGALVSVGADDDVRTEAQLKGRALGIEFAPDGTLWIANAYTGLMRMDPGGEPELVVAEIDGAPLRYANNLDIASDGTVYFSVSTRRFAPQDAEGTLGASILDLMEHGRTGAVFAYDPETAALRTVAEGFSFANGLALTSDESALVLAETGEYRLWRIELGAREGEKSILLDGLPGFPDNVQRDPSPDGDRIWVGLVSPRRAIADLLAPYPFLRGVP